MALSAAFSIIRIMIGVPRTGGSMASLKRLARWSGVTTRTNEPLAPTGIDRIGFASCWIENADCCTSGSAHSLARRIVERLRDALRRSSLAEDLDLKAVRVLGERRRNVGQRDRSIHAMAERARCHPTDHFAFVPYRLVTHRIGIACIDDERDQATIGSALAIGNDRRAADEVWFAYVHEAIQSRLGGRVDRAVFPRPVAEAFFQPQRIERTCAEMPESEIGSGAQQTIVEPTLCFGGHPDFETELSGK